MKIWYFAVKGQSVKLKLGKTGKQKRRTHKDNIDSSRDIKQIFFLNDNFDQS